MLGQNGQGGNGSKVNKRTTDPHCSNLRVSSFLQINASQITVCLVKFQSTTMVLISSSVLYSRSGVRGEIY